MCDRLSQSCILIRLGISVLHGIESRVRLIHPRKNEATVCLRLLVVVQGYSCAMWRQLDHVHTLFEFFGDKLDGDAL